MYQAHRIQEAEIVVDEILRQTPSQREAQLLLGYLWVNKGENRKALEQWVSLVPYFAEDTEIYHKIGTDWHNLRVLDKACGAYHKSDPPAHELSDLQRKP